VTKMLNYGTAQTQVDGLTQVLVQVLGYLSTNTLVEHAST